MATISLNLVGEPQSNGTITFTGTLTPPSGGDSGGDSGGPPPQPAPAETAAAYAARTGVSAGVPDTHKYDPWKPVIASAGMIHYGSWVPASATWSSPPS